LLPDVRHCHCCHCSAAEPVEAVIVRRLWRLSEVEAVIVRRLWRLSEVEAVKAVEAVILPLFSDHHRFWIFFEPAPEDRMDVLIFGEMFNAGGVMTESIIAVDLSGGETKTEVAVIFNPHHRTFLIIAAITQDQEIRTGISKPVKDLLNPSVIVIRKFFTNTGAGTFVQLVLKAGIFGFVKPA
jgi:hypothetical protein